jgi:hypothetical protein
MAQKLRPAGGLRRADLTHVTVLRAAFAVAVAIVLGAMSAPQAAAFSYSIAVVGNGVTASGSITFPADAGVIPDGIDLTLDAVLFGTPVSFTEADLQTAGWTGAAPNDLVDLLVDNLALFAFVGDAVFVLTDDGGGLGAAECSGVAGVCGPSSVTWTYTPQPSTPVSEPSSIFQLLAGLSTLAGWRGRRILATCRTTLQRRRAGG